MRQLRIEHLEKRHQGQIILHNINLTIQQGEFVVFVGPSGCGKTTLLRSLAGLEDIHGGRILLDERDVSEASPIEREVAMVFQSYALYPHLSVFENLAFPLRVAKLPEAQIVAAVHAAAESLQLTAYLRHKPGMLSGGQRQRVAIGRAIVRKPAIFLFDEPLSNLDAGLRGSMRQEISRLHRTLGVTTLYVTHDQIEAMTMADRIVVLNKGRIEQSGTPQELYFQPRSLFVAQFIGHPQINTFATAIEHQRDGRLQLALPSLPHIPLLTLSEPPLSDNVTLAIRPEHILLSPTATGIEGELPFEVGNVEWQGNQSMLYGEIGGQPACCVTADYIDRSQLSRCYVRFPADRILLFDAGGKRCVTYPVPPSVCRPE
ncbi:ABC transporter ATP-binding protein [Erwinia sp. S38]|uniref:ABC transporter ATP-binding protein n=1 Tax=Erwinia sp. S38 TaxID=2769338 RepID=UPI001909B046|nr:ABC transporter ATP-binding protein [Erwinia sp. S38]MBK0002674.1 ABC transporter ATP-binding protein [Erwinia sp. S38]